MEAKKRRWRWESLQGNIPWDISGSLASCRTQWEQSLCFTIFCFLPAATHRTPETVNVLIARSGQCLTWHLGRGIMQTDFHMWSLPVVLGPKHPHHVRTQLLRRRWHFNWEHLLPFLLFLARFGLFVWAGVCVQTRLRVSQEAGHEAQHCLLSLSSQVANGDTRQGTGLHPVCSLLGLENLEWGGPGWEQRITFPGK